MDLKRVFLLLRDENTRVVQTHISVVFIKRDVVYKVKKPVNFGFLDFSTLEKRRFYCEEEVRLNRRLCPEAYIGVEPLVWQEKVIEYAVVMRPLPMERCLKKLILNGEATKQDLERVVKKIADFHKSCETNQRISEFGKCENFRKNTDENFQQTEAFVGKTIDSETYNFLKGKTEEFYKKYGDLLDERAAKGFVRDCHGDLHTEHIVLTDNICIFDCIEFNERFRFIDVVCDFAFLLMDLDYLGAEDLSRYAEDLYFSLTRDDTGRSLLPLFKSYRAYVRGKVNSFMSVDEAIPPQERAKRVEEAKRYFALARSYMEQAW